MPALGSGYGSRPAKVKQQTKVKPAPTKTVKRSSGGGSSYSSVSSISGSKSYRHTRSTPSTYTSASSVSSVSPPTRPSQGPSRRRRILSILQKDDSDTLAALKPSQKSYWKQRTSEEGTQKAAKREVRKVWQDAKEKTGLSGKMPDVVFDSKDPKGGTVAYVQGRTVHLPPYATQSLGAAYLVGRKARAEGRSLALHELAHTQQRQVGGYKPRRDEGMAVRFERMASKKLGIPGKNPQSGDYKRYTRLSRERDSRRKILYGQFLKKGEERGRLLRPTLSGESKAAPYSTVSARTGADAYRASARRGAKEAERKARQESQRAERIEKRLTKAAKKSQGGLAQKLDRGFGPNETISPREAAIVAESEGLPGITYAKAIVPGESGYRPGVRNPDDGYPSLFQMTPSVQSAATKAKWDKIASKRPGGYSNPIVAAKQARILAKGSADEGVSNYYGHNPSAPHGHLPGGKERARKILYGEDKPIPKKLKGRAKKVLGEERTKKIIKRAKEVKVSGPTQKPGEWGGSQRAVLEVIPKGVRPEGRGDKRTPAENAAVGGSPTSDHLTTNTNTYAADLPPNDAVARKIAARLGMESYTGTNEVVKDGYRYQLIWRDAGHYDHIHLGAEWVGPGATETSTSSGSGTLPAPLPPGAARSTGGASASLAKSRKRRTRRSRREQLLQDVLARYDERQESVKAPQAETSPQVAAAIRRVRAMAAEIGL